MLGEEEVDGSSQMADRKTIDISQEEVQGSKRLTSQCLQ